MSEKFVSHTKLLYNWLQFPFLQEIAINYFFWCTSLPFYNSNWKSVLNYLHFYFCILIYTEVGWQKVKSEGECEQEISSS